MSILIKNMEMPTSCPCKLVKDEYDLYCFAVNGIPARAKEYDKCCENGTRPDWCPLVEVPPHGRLIDADILKAKQQEDADLFYNAHTFMDKLRRDEALNAVANIVNMPTIIEAENEI